MRAICAPIERPWWMLLWVCVALAGTTISIDAVMSAIKQAESGGRPFAILDNATGKSYFLADGAAAVAKAKSLLDLGHNIDMGLMQINSIHLKRPGVTADNVFSVAIQDSMSRAIFNEFYALSKAQNGDNDLAVWRAVGAYNMGARGIRVDNVSYTNKVQAGMGLSPRPSVGAEETAARMGTVPRNPLLNPTPRLTIPGEWKVGEPIQATSATETGADDDESDLTALLLALLMIAVVLLLAKVGLLWWAINTVLSWSARQALKQMARRRDRDYSVS